MSKLFWQQGVRMAALAVLGAGCATLAWSQTIIDEWANVQAPPPPALKAAKIETKETALLMLDFVKQICGARPRCIATLPRMQTLLAQARQNGMQVIYSLAGQSVANCFGLNRISRSSRTDPRPTLNVSVGVRPFFRRRTCLPPGWFAR